MSTPTDLEDLGYGRGQLRAGPAASIRRLDVRLGRPVDINRAYADYDQQMRYYLAYVAYVNGRGPWAPLALHPDKSWHCKGLAVDSDDAPGYRGPLSVDIWREHGWLFEVREELWHGQYYTSMDKHYGETTSGGATPFPDPGTNDPQPLEDHDMARIISSPAYRAANQYVYVTPYNAFPIDQVTRAALLPSGIPWCDYDNEDSFNAELRLVYTAAGNVSADWARAVSDEFGDRLG
jgi:hypothetical protein